MDAQRELRTTSGGKPTFQWIEAAPMEHQCKEEKQLDPTPATVRAETWLAIAGGAGGDRLLPEPLVGADRRRDRPHEPRDQGTEPGAARPGRERNVGCPGGTCVGEDPERRDLRHRRQHDRSTLQAKFTVDGIAGRSPVVFGGGQVVGADDTGLHRQLRPARPASTSSRPQAGKQEEERSAAKSPPWRLAGSQSAP